MYARSAPPAKLHAQSMKASPVCRLQLDFSSEMSLLGVSKRLRVCLSRSEFCSNLNVFKLCSKILCCYCSISCRNKRQNIDVFLFLSKSNDRIWKCEKWQTKPLPYLNLQHSVSLKETKAKHYFFIFWEIGALYTANAVLLKIILNFVTHKPKWNISYIVATFVFKIIRLVKMSSPF